MCEMFYIISTICLLNIALKQENCASKEPLSREFNGRYLIRRKVGEIGSNICKIQSCSFRAVSKRLIAGCWAQIKLDRDWNANE